MALVSPGVQVTVTDQSQYVPSVASSVPYVLLVTASNKPSGSGTGIAPGTLPENANKLYLMTSQEDLLATFGQPYFYNNTQGTPINGYELNEYGLLAAYSALAQTTRLYVQRANVDLAALTASLTRPTLGPADGSYWFDTTSSTYGVNIWNNASQSFSTAPITVLNDTTYLNSGSTQPLATYGALGDIVMVTTSAQNFFYQKVGFGQYTTNTGLQVPTAWSTKNNTWQIIGSPDWFRFQPIYVSPYVDATYTPSPQFSVAVNTTIANIAGANMYFWYIEYLDSIINGGVATGTYASAQVSDTNIRFIWYVDSSATTISKSFNGLSFYDTNTNNASGESSGMPNSLYGAPRFLAGGSYNYPLWNEGAAPVYTVAGSTPYNHQPLTPFYGGRWNEYVPSSIWQNIDQNLSTGNGTKLIMKQYSAALEQWIPQTLPIYENNANANFYIDRTGGGTNIPVGTIYAQFSPYNYAGTNFGVATPPTYQTAGYQFWKRYTTGPTAITMNTLPGTFVVNNTFTIQATAAGSQTYSPAVTATLTGTTAVDFISALNLASVPYVSASLNADGYVVITHSQGGDIILTNGTGTPLATAGVSTTTTGITLNNVFGPGFLLSNWATGNAFPYTASAVAPTQIPTNGTYWYYSDATVADIMINNAGVWSGYQTVANTIRGENLTLTNATGPIFSATAPTTQNNVNLSSLVAGDLWISTANLDVYPQIYRWQAVNGTYQWVLIDNTDHVTPSGILFADARWAPNGTTNPITAPLPTIASLLVSDYVDLDAPDPLLYPNGTLLWNTRRSGYNVKQYTTNYFTQVNFPDATSLPTVNSTWLNASGNNAQGAPYMGRRAQRAVIVKALKSGIDTNLQVREDQRTINLIACPQYPELAPNMVALNNERNNTSFVLVDTPLRLAPADVVTWATNNNGLGIFTEDGLLVNEPYSATWYPSCLTNDLSGNQVVTSPSHMIMRTILRSDYVSYPWIASAGTQRGVVDNATQIGYLDAATNKFISIGVNQGLRDVLYTNQINPITTVQGSGIVNFGNKTTTGVTSALDRINVARLVAFVRAQLENLAKLYLFEPNDTITRNSITNTITSLMVELVNKRAIYDYLVVCDATNNTPARIDRNELWVDIAIEPVKAVEFIYIPIRIKNTGSIQAGT